MDSEKPLLTTPVAILIGAAIVGAGLFFGLQARAPDAAPSAPASSAPSVPPSHAPTGGPAPTQAAQPVSDGPSDEKVVALTTVEIEKHRKRLVEKCWTASSAPMPDPPVARMVFNFTFDAAGKTIARGMVEDRRAQRSGVAACVSQELPEITIAAPGRNVRVEVPLSMP